MRWLVCGREPPLRSLVGSPGDVRGGIFDGMEQSGYPAFGGGMRRSFEHMLDLNRPMQPRSSDLP
jgi:hypothetical protein